MSVVYYKNGKTGRTYAYEVTSQTYDAEKGYSVPKRKYLGRVDPDTNEIIPSKGKRGRPRSTKPDSPNDDGKGVYEEWKDRYLQLLESKTQIEKELAEEKRKNRRLIQKIKGISQTLGDILSQEEQE